MVKMAMGGTSRATSEVEARGLVAGGRREGTGNSDSLVLGGSGHSTGNMGMTGMVGNGGSTCMGNAGSQAPGAACVPRVACWESPSRGRGRFPAGGGSDACRHWTIAVASLSSESPSLDISSLCVGILGVSLAHG